MRSIAKFLVHAFVFTALTLLTQVGGIPYIVALGSMRFIRPHTPLRRIGTLIAATAAGYALLTAAIVPALAPLSGRMKIPCALTTTVSCALNRNYARPDLVGLTLRLNQALAARYPGSGVTVLDANFPFLDAFPLIPHLSHDDGNKVDLAFFYRDASSGAPIPSGSPSPIGYFHFQQPHAGEAQPCAGRVTPLRWDFAWAQPDQPAWQLDAERTQAMIQWWQAQPEVTRIFVEPYLAQRLGVAAGKVRFQGCQAARHDDHVHVQIE